MGTTILFTAAADLFDAMTDAPQHMAHVRVFRAVQRDRTQAWQEARVAEALSQREARERAADLRLEAMLDRYTSTNAIA